MAEGPAGGGRTIIVYRANTHSEAMVLRGLLESAGIASPGSESANPFPLAEPPRAQHDADIAVLESQAQAAREIINSYVTAGQDAEAGELP